MTSKNNGKDNADSSASLRNDKQKGENESKG
jgi:hypothetical protein